MTAISSCRSCDCPDLWPVIDLGEQPLANNLLRGDDLAKPEPKFPLAVQVCPQCWLMQISHVVPPVDLFSEYVYFSSFSDEMLRHSRAASLRYIEEKRLDPTSFVVEIASNDGYLLKNFVEAGIPCLGFEPAANIAEVAPEICVEILSPSNTAGEMTAKRRLYFEAGALEVWICSVDGKMEFYAKSNPDGASDASTLCSGFPSRMTDHS